MTQLLIADDHTLMREGLKHLFELYEDVQVVAEAADGIQALEKLRSVSVLSLIHI